MSLDSLHPSWSFPLERRSPFQACREVAAGRVLHAPVLGGPFGGCQAVEHPPSMGGSCSRSPPRQKGRCLADVAAARLPFLLCLGERSTQGFLRVVWK